MEFIHHLHVVQTSNTQRTNPPGSTPGADFVGCWLFFLTPPPHTTLQLGLGRVQLAGERGPIRSAAMQKPRQDWYLLGQFKVVKVFHIKAQGNKSSGSFLKGEGTSSAPGGKH